MAPFQQALSSLPALMIFGRVIVKGNPAFVSYDGEDRLPRSWKELNIVCAALAKVAIKG